MQTTKIEWTDKTWNPVTGCTKFSAGCQNCYAEVTTNRLQAFGIKKYEAGFGRIVFHEETLKEPLQWKKPCMIFVCSMSDLFHTFVSVEDIFKVLSVIEKTPQHTYQILTKRTDKMRRFFSNSLRCPENVWLGTTIENREAKHRIKIMQDTPAPIRFLSCEPLLEDLDELDLRGIDWVIVGGESGVKARQMKKEWVENIQRQCEEQHVPFFFKQWGVYGEDGIKRNKKQNGRLLNGKIYGEMPTKQTTRQNNDTERE